MNKLSRIKQVDLRKAWNHEAHHFTNWLAEDENIALLSDEVGIDIHVLQTEASVGKFNVDILAEEENSGRKIIIENQLEMTNHDHLGKVITYASGLDAEIIIWIVKDVREEHKQAIDWLNEHTDENINFFAIKLELWQIGDSDLAPKFQIISRPNDWAKSLKSIGQGGLTETKTKQLEFWKQFIEYAKENKTKLTLRKPNAQHWYDLSYGNSLSHISLTINSRENQMATEIYIPDNKDLFAFFEKSKESIESELGEKLQWLDLEGKRATRIKLTHEADLDCVEDWNNYFEWLKEKAEAFHSVFGKQVKKMQR